MQESSSTHSPPRSVLERSEQRAQIDAQLALVPSGAGSSVMLAGPAGIGKSTLLSLGVADARQQGFRVLAAQGRPLEQEYAFGVALALFEPLAGRDDLLEGSAGLARPLLDPSERHRLPEGDSFSIIHGLYWLTERLAQEQPVLIVVDDLQWVDEPSMRVLAYLAERVGTMSAGLLTAVRTHPDGVVPAEIDRALQHQSDATCIPVPPLSLSAVESLVTALVQPPSHGNPLAQACHQLTGGNPLLVVETLREVAEFGALPVGEPGSPPEALLVPSVRRRLDQLPEAARRLAQAAVVVGGGPLDLVAEVADLSPLAARAALDQLRSASLVESDEPVRVTHAIVGDALAADLPLSARAALHQAALDALDCRSAPLDVLAAHAAATSPQGSRRVVEVLTTAASGAVRRGKPSHALTLLRRCLAEPPDDELRFDLFAKLARTEALLGDPRWQDHLASAVGLDPSSAPRARLRVANALVGAGALREAAEQYELGLRSVQDPASELGLRLLIGLSHALLIDVTNDRSVLDRAEAALGPDLRADTRARRDLLRHVAYARALSVGTRDEVLELVGRAMDGVEHDEMVSGSTAISGMLALLFADDEHILPALLDQGIESARAAGRLGTVAALSNYRGLRALWRGDVDVAIADLSLARDGLAESGAGVLPGACGNLALVQLEQNDPAAAERSLVLPGAIDAHQEGASFSSWLWARSQVRAARGDLAGALEDALECGRRQRRMGSLNPATIPWEFTTADLLARSGRREEARALIDEALDRARHFGAPRTLSHGLRAAAGLSPPEIASQLLEESLEVLEGTAWRLERIRTVLAVGRLLVASGRRSDGAHRLREALDLAHDSGLTWVAAQATMALRATGARPRRPRLTGPEALTPTERVIAELAASGLTNRQIAERRFVTMKAVEFHLGNAYRKLGIKNRAALERSLAGDA